MINRNERNPMERKLNCVLLIDDDEPTNFLNQVIIERAGCAEEIKTVQRVPFG